MAPNPSHVYDCERMMPSWPTGMMPNRQRWPGSWHKRPPSSSGSDGMRGDGTRCMANSGRCWRRCAACAMPRWAGQIRGTKDRPALTIRIAAMRKSPQAADYVLIMTTLTEAAADAAEILAGYRLRWQIEIAFKRLKGLLHIDELRAFDPDLAQTYLLAKLLGAVLVDAIRTQGPDFSPPFGYSRLRISRSKRYPPPCGVFPK